jgi:NitT/TauT family transport system ATP-binding protein
MRPAPAARLSLTAVKKSIGGRVILDGLTLDVPGRRLTAVIGPSGCGKSTMINLIAGYESPDAGTITMDGEPVTRPGWDRLVVFQETALFPWKSTLDNVVFGPRNRGERHAGAVSRARALLGKFGLSGFDAKLPVQLSGGMQRRAELARAMINAPRAMLLDEPFRGLDALTRELMQEYLLRVFEAEPVTTVFVTSEIEEAIYLADRVVVLSAAPTTVKDVIEVELPRPRAIGMLSLGAFAASHARILQSLFDEASKSFEQGSQAAADLLEGAASLRLPKAMTADSRSS